MDWTERELENLIAEIQARQAQEREKHPLLTLQLSGSSLNLLERKDERNLRLWLHRLEGLLREEIGLGPLKIRVLGVGYLAPGEWVLQIRKTEVASGRIYLDKCLVLGSSKDLSAYCPLEPQVDHDLGVAAVWLPPEVAKAAESEKIMAFHPSSALALKLGYIIKKRAMHLIDRQGVADLLAELRRSYPAVVNAVTPSLFSLGDITTVLKGLLRESVSIADLVPILETMADYAKVTRDPEMILEFVRVRLAPSICRRLSEDDAVHVVTLSPFWERTIQEATLRTDLGSFLTLDPDLEHKLVQALEDALDTLRADYPTIAVLVSPRVRPRVCELTAFMEPKPPVLSWNEVQPRLKVHRHAVIEK